MNIDFEKIENYLKDSRKIEQELNDKTNLFEKDLHLNFQDENKNLEKRMEELKKDNQVLRIGVIGMVKAGKSSLINALLFKGKDVLPKAATAMTAALTRISYSEESGATVYFYNQNDWNEINRLNSLYEAELDTKYNQVIRSGNNKRLTSHIPTKEEFSKGFKASSSCYNDAHELISMIDDNSIFEKLGKSDNLSGNYDELMEKLNTYVGSNGKYTPIVNYVELRINDKSLEGYEIVDTPGLEDTVESRCRKTREFLKECNVALVISQCGSVFSTVNTDLIVNRLPGEGIGEIILIGSRFDSALCNFKGENFKFALKETKSAVEDGFNKISDRLSETRKGKNLNQLIKEKPQCVSSICYSIWEKLKNNSPFNKEEEKVINNLSYLVGFEEFYNKNKSVMATISGIPELNRALSNVKSRRIEILEENSKNLVETAKIKQLRILNQIETVVENNLQQLQHNSEEEIHNKKESILRIITSSKNKLSGVFSDAAYDCKRKVEEIFPQIILEKENHVILKEKSQIEHKVDHYREGFFGLKKRVVEYDITKHSVSTSQVIDNLEEYGARCHNLILEDFATIFDKHRLSNNIKNIMLSSFKDSGLNYDEDEILIPLNSVLNKITIPEIRFDYSQYIEEIETKFPLGFAEGEDIHKLKFLQTSQMSAIQNELSDKLISAAKEIEQTLQIESNIFADKVRQDFSDRLSELENQAKEKELYISKYEDFKKQLIRMKLLLGQCDKK